MTLEQVKEARQRVQQLKRIDPSEAQEVLESLKNRLTKFIDENQIDGLWRKYLLNELTTIDGDL